MKKLMLWVVCVMGSLGMTSVNEAKWNPFRHERSGEENAQLLIKKMLEIDSSLQKVFDSAAGWAVFPKISKVGIGVGGAHGYGRVYEKGRFVGTSEMTQVSVGFQLGAQVYGEIIFFQDAGTMERFKSGHFAFGANVGAVVIDKGAAGEAGFKDGTLVVVRPHKGLMYEATLAGQEFTYKAQ